MLIVLRRREAHIHLGACLPPASGARLQWVHHGYLQNAKWFPWSQDARVHSTSTFVPSILRWSSKHDGAVSHKPTVNGRCCSWKPVGCLSCQTFQFGAHWLWSLELALMMPLLPGARSAARVSRQMWLQGKDPNSNESPAFSTFKIRKLRIRTLCACRGQESKGKASGHSQGVSILVLSSAQEMEP